MYKTSHQRQAQKNMRLAPSAEKHASGAKRRKTYVWCQARENMRLVPSAGKAKRGIPPG